YSVPMVALAPALFSTTTGTPRMSENLGAMMRATISLEPPGGKPTTRVTGWDGYLASADALAVINARPATSIALLIGDWVFAASLRGRRLNVMSISFGSCTG